MLDQQHGNIFFSCDDCGEVLDTKTSSFEAARNMLRRANWRITKVGEEWRHYCVECSDDNR